MNQQGNVKNLNLRGLRLLRRKRGHIKYLSSCIDSLDIGENREIHNVLKETHLDLLLIGTSAPLYSSVIALIAYECQILTIYLTDMFIELPPPKNSINKDINQNYADNNLRYLLFTIFNKDKIINSIAAIKKSFWMIILGFKDDIDIIKNFAIHREISLELFDFSLPLPFKLLYLFLCPEELDFPNSFREECYYAEASIDLQREESFFDWSKLNKDKALIYCCLGTTGETFETLGIKKVKKFFQTVIDAVSLKNKYQLVISVSDYINVEDFHSIPENTIIVNRASQLALLEKASIAIINRGVRTMKECIYWGVLMIVFPIFFDQPENAERIEDHGLGVVGKIKNTSVSLIMDLAENIENDFLLKQRVEAWKNKFQEIENSVKAAKFILDILEQNKRI
ncbi:MAG: UDP-glucuronosyltransferase-like glycosyl transferase [Nostoc sp.]|uniref:glycosyltransferase n=1 Tax=Nostoc sp. TaxID=1180 RepID=UPI002FF63980